MFSHFFLVALALNTALVTSRSLMRTIDATGSKRALFHRAKPIENRQLKTSTMVLRPIRVRILLATATIKQIMDFLDVL